MEPVDVVIAGIGGAFPESADIDAFYKHIQAGDNLASVDDRRWKPGVVDADSHVAKTEDVRFFDNNMFGVHRSLAVVLDPLGRLMLERSLEAILDAGITPRRLYGTNSQVYIAATVSESESLTMLNDATKNASGYAIMSAAKTMMANRISFFYNINGTSVTVDGDWTIAITALERAARSIRSGECEFAIVGCANTALHPELSKMYENLGFISADGYCRTIDGEGRGFFRAEGCVVFLLQRADTAHRIYAYLAGLGETCIGERERFVGVRTPALAPLMKGIYNRAGVDPDDVEMLDVDGLAIPEIDSAELATSALVLCGKKRGAPLRVTAAKPTIGHSDAAATSTNIVHAILAMEHEEIPPILKFNDPRDPVDPRLQVVRKPEPLSSAAPVALNTLGWAGCLGHVVLKPHLKRKAAPPPESEYFPRLVTVAARTAEDIERVSYKIAEHSFDPEYIRLTQEAFSDVIPGYGHKGFTVLPPPEGFRKPVVQMQETGSRDRPLWLAYSGMGSQWPGMAEGLMRLPEFAETIQRLRPLLLPKGIDLIQILVEKNPAHFEKITNSFVAIAAVQIGLTNVLRTMGLEIAGIIGHSTGELGCAYGDGVLTDEQALLAAYARGKASTDVKLVKGMMASVGVGWQDLVDVKPPSVDIACHNSTDNTTISGPADDVAAFVDVLKGKNIFARAVNVANIAYHSRYIQPAGPGLRALLSELITDPKPRSPRWISSCIPPERLNTEDAKMAGAAYFTTNLLSPVLFVEAMRAVPPGAVVLELAPHGLLQPLIRRELPEGASTLSLTKRGHPDGLRCLLEGFGKLYLEGIPIKPWILAPEVPLPVSRATPCLSNLATWDHREVWPLVTNPRSVASRQKVFPMYPTVTPSLQFSNRQYCLVAYLLAQVWKEEAANYSLSTSDFPVIFQKIAVKNAAEICYNQNVSLAVQIQHQTGKFEVAAETNCGAISLIDGFVRRVEIEDLQRLPTAAATERSHVTLQSADIYAELQNRDVVYGEDMKTLRSVSCGQRELIAQCAWSGCWVKLLDGMLQLGLLRPASESPLIFQMRSIIIVPEEAPPSHKDAHLRLDLVQGTVTAPGVHMVGLKGEEESAASGTTSAEIGLMPYGDLKSSGDVITLTAHLATEAASKLGRLVTVLELPGSESVSSKIGSATRLIVGGQNTARVVRKLEGPVRDVVIVVCGSQDVGGVPKLRAQVPSGTLLVLVHGARPVIPGYAVIAENGTGQNALVLLTEVQPLNNAEVVLLAPGQAPPEDVATQKEVVLVWEGMPAAGILASVDIVSRKSYSSRARIVVNMDKQAPRFSLKEPVFAKQLSLGLAVNVLQSGQWCGLRLRPLPNTTTVPTSVRGLETSHIGINPADLAETEDDVMADVFDFVGVRDGRRVMGIASRDESGNVMPDTTLCWPVPEGWTSEDAATVPVAYALAYHAMVVLGQLKRGAKIFIENGSTLVGQAALRIANSHSAEVFTTASSDRQRQQILAAMPQLNPKRVLRSDTENLEKLIHDFTEGKGYDIVLLSNPGKTAKVAIARLGYNGSAYIFTRKSVMENSIGMSIFTINTAVKGVCAHGLLNMRNSDKQALQAALRSGAIKGVVQPLQCRRFSGATIVPRNLRGPEKVVACLQDREDKQTAANYILVGGSAGGALTVARVLAAHGARLLLAATSSARTARTPALAQVPLVRVPSSVADATAALDKAVNGGTLAAVIVVVQDASENKLPVLMQEALASCSGPKRGARLIVLSQSLLHGTGAVETHRANGAPATTVVGSILDSAKVIAPLLRTSLPEAVIVSYGRRGLEEVAGTALAAISRTESASSNAMDTLTCPEAPVLELCTLSPRLRHRGARVEPLPLFAVQGPGLGEDTLRVLGRYIMSPMLVLRIGQSVQHVVKEVLQIQPRGPWALVGSAQSAELLVNAAAALEREAGRPDWREVVSVAVLNADLRQMPPFHTYAGPLHLVTPHHESKTNSIHLDERRTLHLVNMDTVTLSSRGVATIINEHLLSPLLKVVAC